MAMTIVASIVVAWLGLSLSGCGCEKGKLPEEQQKKTEQEGVALVGMHDNFGVQVKSITCTKVDDGLFGGKAEEPSFKLSCTGGYADGTKEGTFKKDFKEGDKSDSDPFFFPTDKKCFYAGVGGLSVTCQKGSGVRLDIQEKDTFSSSETGSNTLSWEMIQFAPHGMRLSFPVSTSSTGAWDKMWAGVSGLTGGICITDLIPGAKIARTALKLSPKAVKMIKAANRNKRRYEKMQDKLGRCGDLGVEPCGDAADVMQAAWDAQCVTATLNGGTYTVEVQVSSSFHLMPPLATLMVMCAVVFTS